MKLRCRSVNHRRIAHRADAVITRCVKCGKPTCSDCEGTDNGFRDICDDCWFKLHNRVERARDCGYHRTARAILRKWAMRGRPLGFGWRRHRTYYSALLSDYDLDTPETGYKERK